VRPLSRLPLILVTLIGSLAASQLLADGHGSPAISGAQEAAVKKISARRLKAHVDLLAADELGGRIPGSVGHTKAREYIARQMKAVGLKPAGKDGGYLHTYAEKPIGRRFQRLADGRIVPHKNDLGVNLVGLVEGTDPKLSKEYIVYVAHYDHLGVTRDGEVFNGAFDNATGVAVGLEVARVLLAHGAAPKRSILFLFSDAEESGLKGARAWLGDPTVPLESVVMGISGDPLGRRILPDYGAIILSGLERSPKLLDLFRKTTGFAEHDVAFTHRDIIPIFSSDHDCFHEFKIPATWFVNPGFSFYHQTTDTAETIDYRILLDSARYIARAMLLVGDTAERFEYRGAPKMTAQTGRDAKVVVEGCLSSKLLTPRERKRGERLRAGLEKVIAAGGPEALEDPKRFFYECVAFLFQVSRSHPGAIPPPFPAEASEGAKPAAPKAPKPGAPTKRRLY
jgi:Zn-dependent M28 family amino/carboxypeptidase